MKTSTLMMVGLLGACGGTGLPALGSLCIYNGQGFAAGAAFASSDGCNTCNCNSDGKVVCTDRACVPARTGCDYNGQHYTVFASFDSDCNTCSCLEDGKVICTERACVTVPPAADPPACNSNRDCIVVAKSACCPEGEQTAVNRSEEKTYGDAHACAEKNPICPPVDENEQRAVCDASHQCVLVER